jgi:hypothetical protein
VPCDATHQTQHSEELHEQQWQTMPARVRDEYGPSCHPKALSENYFIFVLGEMMKKVRGTHDVHAPAAEGECASVSDHTMNRTIPDRPPEDEVIHLQVETDPDWNLRDTLQEVTRSGADLEN